MPRKKKETLEVKEGPIIKPFVKNTRLPNFGTGWNKVNNMLQAGYNLKDIRGGK